MTSDALCTDDLGKRYGERWALRHLTFAVAAGEIVALLGPNGAGKSTIMRILTGLLRPTEGRATVDGVLIGGATAGPGARIGVTFEQQNLYERLTVRENLDFFAAIGGLGNKRALEVLEEAGLADRARDLVSTLSKGLRQRLMLARALLGRPRVLFLDEPTSGLDPRAAEGLQRWVARLASEGTAVLLATHDMHEAERLAGRVAILHAGELRAIGEPEALTTAFHAPRLHVALRAEAGVETHLLEGPPAEQARQIALLSDRGEIAGLREERASLGDVFLTMTGARLEA
ncbi:MAG: ABC transporter ATP-binding protein [Proteobacteria bacterium]|nr:ABC transporter ATP-binding protein [Pseudomonadota bacterium]